MPLEVGVVGLGIMGGSIANLLLDRGYKVFGFDLSASQLEAAEANGVDLCSTVQGIFDRSDVIFTSLPSGSSLMSTLKEVNSYKEGAVIVDLSTLSLNVKQQAHDLCRSKNIDFLDCPISGTGAQAVNGDLVIYASGSNIIYLKIEKVFTAFSRICHYVGPFGNGTKLKLAANLLVAIHNAATAEAINLAQTTGIDNDVILNLLGAGAGGSRVFELRAPMMLERSYVPATMKLSTWAKDLTLIEELAQAFDADTPLFEQASELYKALALSEPEAHDTAAIIESYKK
jgi:L-threonate 2-dehydrogenase